MKRMLVLLTIFTVCFLSACGNTDVVINNNLGDMVTENGYTANSDLRESKTEYETAFSTLSDHAHIYADADCINPKICNICGIAEGSALGHNYIAATCTSPKICSLCGETSGEALGHNYVNNACSFCGKTDPDSLPVGLDKIFVIDSYQYEYKPGTFTDSFGKKYNGVHYFTDLYQSGNGNEPHAMFNLNGQYKTFSGSIVASTETEPEWTYYINIYVDGILKFSKTGFTKTSGEVDFEIDVSTADTLEIRAGLEGNTGDWCQEIGIVNAQLTK